MTTAGTDPVRTARLVHAGASLASVGIGGVLAVHYPLSPLAMLAAFALVATLAYLRPRLWLLVVPAALPAIGFASWTGWIAYEELDILILAVAAGGYAALAFASKGDLAADGERHLPGGLRSFRMPVYARALAGLFALSLLVALARGIAGAATYRFGFFDGYDDAINSVRIGKSFFLALWLLPLLRIELARAPARALDRLASGLATGLGIASLAVIWERVAFPGLLNFSTDYRATALFWEMHVGGAALDGFLAITAPFVLWQLLRKSTPLHWAIAGGIAMAAAYACLATFSRGLYLALPASLVLLALLLLRQRQALSLASAGLVIARIGALAALAAAAAYVVFRAGGYRSLLAVLAIVVLAMLVGTQTRRLATRAALVAAGWGCVVGVAGAVVAHGIPKGPYLVFAFAFACCAGLALRSRRQDAVRATTWAVAAYVFAIVAAAVVAGGWGGSKALRDSAIVLLLLLVSSIWNARSAKPLWPAALRAQAAVAGGAALVAISVAVFSGGAYMNGRFDSAERDFGGRMRHWQDGISMLATPADWLLGKGLGRYPQTYTLASREGEIPGAYRIDGQGAGRALALYGPRHDGGFGETLRVAQRIRVVPRGQYSVTLDVRATEDVQLHVEICEQHLLYNEEGCAIASADIRVADGVAQHKVLGLDGRNLSESPWYAPRLALFALAVESPGRHIEIDDVSLLGPDGREVLANGDFAGGMRRWFIVSERMHLPWHIKNIVLDVLFDQGLAGLLCFVLLTGAALMRLVAGRASRHPAAPFVAAALVGFLVVGAFDSLLDVPRDAFLFYLLVLLGFTLPAAEGDRAPLAATTTTSMRPAIRA